MTTKTLSRPLRRLFYCLIAVLGTAFVHATGPTMTTITDVVYRANGQAAAGTIVVTWPAFNTADNKPVAAGVLSIEIGAEGTVNFALVPNEGGDPGGTFYKAVYKLTDGTTFTEYWVVPATSPTTVAAIRASVVPRQVGAQFVNRQYVDTAVASTHAQVVHKTGSEAITGVKSFAASPEVPAPASGTAAVNQDYVTSAVSAISDGFVDRSGDTMTGPLTVPDAPVAPGHATNRQYVDLQVADVAAGLTAKLGRINDTPISLAGVRYANQFALGESLSAQVDAACANLSGATGMVTMPAVMEASGLRSVLPDNCHVSDERRTSGPNDFGTDTTAHQKAWVHRMRWTAPNSDVASGSTSTGQTFGAINVFVNAQKGGINTGSFGKTNKSNYAGMDVTLNAATPGQKTAFNAKCISFGAGDCFGAAAFSSSWGGGLSGVGDEKNVPLTARMLQGDTVFTGTVSVKSGNILTFSPTTNHQTLGAGLRYLLNLTTGIYSTGTANFNTASTTVNGVGTLWAALTPATDYCFSRNSATVGVRKFAVPVASITNDTTLVLASAAPSYIDTSTGAYALYKCSEVKEVTSNDITSTAPSLPVQVELVSAANFAVADQTELPLSPYWGGTGTSIVLFPSVASLQTMTALGISNSTAFATIPARNGVSLSGNYTRAYEFSGHTSAPQYGMLWNTGSYASTFINYVGSNVDNETVHLDAVVRNAATTGDARFSYLKNGEYFELSSNDVSAHRHTFSTTGANAGIGIIPQSGTALHIVPDTADKGIVLNGNATGDVLDVQVAAVSKFKVAGGGAVTATGTITAGGFSGPLTGAVTGNASTASTLQTARTINGVAFNGSANITVTAELPANPSACGANQFANDIAADGTLTCAQLAYSGISGTPTLFNQTIQDEGSSLTQRATLNFAGSGVSCADDATKTTCTVTGGGSSAFTDITAGTNAAALVVGTGGSLATSGSGTIAATTAAALAANPSDCAAGQFATAIAANGNLTCAVLPPAIYTFYTSSAANPVDGSTTYVGLSRATSGLNTNYATVQMYSHTACTVETVNVRVFVTGTLGSNEAVTYYVRKNGATDSSSTTATWDAAEVNTTWTPSGFTLAAGDSFAIKFLQPTWATNPTTVYAIGTMLCR